LQDGYAAIRSIRLAKEPAGDSRSGIRRNTIV
jgi:hypothetical protein